MVKPIDLIWNLLCGTRIGARTRHSGTQITADGQLMQRSYMYIQITLDITAMDGDGGLAIMMVSDPSAEQTFQDCSCGDD